jgi:hypothetical protein
MRTIFVRQPPSVVPMLHWLAQLWVTQSPKDVSAVEHEPLMSPVQVVEAAAVALYVPPGQTQLRYVLQSLSNVLSCEPHLLCAHE